MSDPNDVPVVSIVIVTYATGPIIIDALDAVKRHTTHAHEVIVVDNLPADPATRTGRILRERADIELLEADDNLGYGGGNEYGVTAARGTYVCFLNPDAIVQPGWLEALLETLADPVVAIAAPVLLDPNGDVQEAGQVVFRDSFTAPVGGPTLLPGWRSNLFSRDIDYASAACWVVRREEHIARAGFDRSFHPAYFEDVDYAFRVEASGQRCRLNSAVPIVHHRGAGVARHRTDIAQQSHRRFQRRWAERLKRQHARPSTDGEALMCRDRLAESRTLFVARSEDLTAERFETMWGDAVALAAAHPRRRITLITDVPVSDERVRVARAGGLEVIGPDDAGSDLGGSVELWTSLANEVVGASSLR